MKPARPSGRLSNIPFVVDSAGVVRSTPEISCRIFFVFEADGGMLLLANRTLKEAKWYESACITCNLRLLQQLKAIWTQATNAMAFFA